MPETRFGTFEDLLEITKEHLRPMAEKLKETVLEIHPETCEVVRLGDKAATYGVGPKKMSEGYVYIMPHASWVNLGFYKGVALNDENGLLEGTGKNLRHIKVKTLEQAESPKVKELIVLAVEERKKALGKA